MISGFGYPSFMKGNFVFVCPSFLPRLLFELVACCFDVVGPFHAVLALFSFTVFVYDLTSPRVLY